MTDPFTLLSLAAFPNAALVFAALAIFGLGVLFNFAVGPRRTEIVEVTEIPEELTRLASVLGITHDAPPTQSYGRMIHDLFEERDMEILALKGDKVDLENKVEALGHLLELVQSVAPETEEVIDVGYTTPPKDGVVTYIDRDGTRWELDPRGLSKPLTNEQIVDAARIGDWAYWAPSNFHCPSVQGEHYTVDDDQELHYYADMANGGAPTGVHLGKTTLPAGHYFPPSAK